MSESTTNHNASAADARVIISGFGIPGRLVAEALEERDILFCVIELNPVTVERCSRTGICIIAGDSRDPAILRQAGIDRASMLVVTIPSETAMLETVEQARRLSSSVHIVARCWYTSGGLEAARRGADEVVVAEQAVAREFSRVVGARVAARDQPDDPRGVTR
jgi:voltage-gated potassium channel Kch